MILADMIRRELQKTVPVTAHTGTVPEPVPVPMLGWGIFRKGAKRELAAQPYWILHVPRGTAQPALYQGPLQSIAALAYYVKEGDGCAEDG